MKKKVTFDDEKQIKEAKKIAKKLAQEIKKPKSK